jgi:hypothetical protein
MSQYATDYDFASNEFAPQADLVAPVRDAGRSKLTPLLLVPSLGLSGIAWMAGGLSPLTDMSFLLLTIVCLILLVRELLVFTQRWGIGGVVLFGGTLVWFCYDYLSFWFMQPQRAEETGFTNDIVAKSAFYTILFVASMMIGVNIRKGQFFVRLMERTPDIRAPWIGFVLSLTLFAIGISPFFLFTSEPWYTAMYHQFTEGRGTHGLVAWTVGRSGNVNYNWGAYVAQILQIGQVGSIYAILWVILVGRNIIQRLIGAGIWVVWLLLGAGTGTRGEVIASMLPVIFAFFVKYSATAAEHAKRVSIRAYVLASVILMVTLIIVQYQVTFRTQGFVGSSLGEVSAKIAGNSMFSEGLTGYRLIPDKFNYFENAYYVEGAIRPIPDTIFWFFVSPMPRALWHSKPIDAAWKWYNEVVTGDPNGTEGTTIATGASGYWFIRYGPFGLIEGGILIGWLMAYGEMLFRCCNGRLNLLLFVLGWETWLFRAFRGFGFADLDALLIGFIALSALTVVANLFAGARGQTQSA